MANRLNKNIERKSRNRLVITVVGSFFILFLLVKYGFPALINFSLFLGGNDTTPSVSKGSDYVAVPTLNQTFTATNSASVAIAGSGVPQEQIDLYVNDTLQDTEKTKDDGTFVFGDVSLENGSNAIKVRAKKGTSQSDFSDPITIVYKTTAPTLTIESPADGQSISHDNPTVVVSGKSDPDVKITVNDFWTVQDDAGNYSYTLGLHDGDNVIRVDAIDAAGNKTERTIKVFRSQ